MLPILTGMIAGGLHVLAIPQHLHALAPRTVQLPVRGGITGGYWGMAHGSVVMAFGLVALLARRMMEMAPSIDSSGFYVGVVLVVVGLVAGYQVSMFEPHDHPHLHDGIEHEHVHLHRADEQLHDHDQPNFGILDHVFAVSNLAAVIPALGLPESGAVLYLVTYLAATTLTTGGLGYWLGYSRRRGAEAGPVLRLASGLGYALAVLGIAWMASWWPL